MPALGAAAGAGAAAAAAVPVASPAPRSLRPGAPAALEARLGSELEELRRQWREHKAVLERSAVEERQRRVLQRSTLASYVRQSMADAAAHSLGRLGDLGTSAAAELTAIATRAGATPNTGNTKPNT